MTVKELTEKLKQLPPDKEVMIKQGEEYDYMTIDHVHEITVLDMDNPDEDEEIEIVAIDYD